MKMFDLVTKKELQAELAPLVTRAEFQSGLALFKVEVERDLNKLEAKLEAKIGTHTIAIIGTVIAAAVALHFGR